MVIISASIEEIVKPVAQYLELGQDYLCTWLAVQDDRYTGHLEGPLCYGPGKIQWAKTWLAENQLDFPQAINYFYTDSSTDLPMLERVGHPRVVNPDPILRFRAMAKRWRILNWRGSGAERRIPEL